MARPVWDFAVSGYAVLPRWLRHREGEVCDFALVSAVLDVCARIAALLDLMARADPVLAAAIADPLTSEDLAR